MKSFILAVIAFHLVLVTSCSDKPPFKEMPEGVINHHLIVVAKTKDGVRARGFKGATPKGSKVFCAVDRQNQEVVSGDDGSFSITLPNTNEDNVFAQLDFIVASEGNKTYQYRYKIKNLAEALGEIAHEPFPTEIEMDSLVFRKDRVAILSSNASLVHTFALDEYFSLGEKLGNSVMLNADPQKRVGARMIAKLGPRLLAPLFQTHEVVFLSDERVIQRSTLLDDMNKPYVFDVNPPLKVINAIDADGSGKETTTIAKTMARNADTIVALDDKHFLVSYTNYFQAADFVLKTDSVVGPGIVALMRADEKGFKTIDVKVVPFKNPQHFVIKDQTTVWVGCTGDWHFVKENLLESNHAGLVKLKVAQDRSSFTIEHQIDLKDFSPAEPVIVQNKIVVPRSWKNEVAVLDETATELKDEHKHVLKFHRQLAFTFASVWHDDVIFLGENRGSLFAFHPDEGFFPFPFVEPIDLNSTIGKDIVLVPIKAFVRHTLENTDYSKVRRPGFDLWVLTAFHQMYPLALELFGP